MTLTIRNYGNLFSRIYASANPGRFVDDVFTRLKEIPFTESLLRGGDGVNVRLGDDLLKIAVRTGGRASRLEVSSERSEFFYGMGMNFREFAITDGRYRMRNQDSPYFMQRFFSYSRVPFFMSSAGWAIFLLDASPVSFHFRAGKRVSIGGLKHADFLLFDGGPARVVQSMTDLSGRPPLVPKRAFGLWNTSYPVVGQEETLSFIREFRKRKIPLDVLILDYHWEEKFHNFKWNRDLFPDPGSYIARARELGITPGLITTPFINRSDHILFRLFVRMIAGKNFPPGMSQFTNLCDRRLYEEGKRRGCYAHDDAPWWFGRGGMIDFTGKEGRDFWNGLTDGALAQGIRFFKNDDGEYLPAKGSRNNAGLDPGEHGNLYSFYYGKAVFENNRERTSKRGLCYARSIWAGAQRHPGVFLGDQKAGAGGMRRSLNAGLAMSLLGFSYWTADLYGLSGRVSRDIHRRYMQYAVLTPIARHFSSPFDPTRDPWHYGKGNESLFRSYVKLRYRLLPHYYSCAWEACQSGLPIVRPLVLSFPEERAARAIAHQFMIGNEIMAVPRDGREKRIYLPEGEWINPYDLTAEAGGRYIRGDRFPADRIPLLVRGGSIIPTARALQHIPERHYFGRIQVNIFPGGPAEYMLYDDYGEGLAYREGEYSLTRVRCDREGEDLRISLERAGGSIAEKREFHVRIFLCRAFREVSVDAGARHAYHPERKMLGVSFSSALEGPVRILVRGFAQG